LPARGDAAIRIGIAAGGGNWSMLISPTPRKVFWTFLIHACAAATLLLRMIPVQYDILDLRELPGLVMVLFLGVPIRIFDAVTWWRFASTGEGFLVFPSGVELLAAVAIDIAAVYLLVCIVFRLKERGSGKESGGSAP
jgi:hypothetical protein